MSTMLSVMLRPLNIGEIFDRAVTLYVQNFVVFSLMLLTVLVPIGIASYAFQGDQVTQMTQAIQAFENPTGPVARQRSANPFPYTPTQMAGLFAILIIAFALSPVASNAVALGVAALYNGRRPDFKECFGQALRAWPRLIGTVFVVGCVLMATYGVGVVSLVLLAVFGVALVKLALPLAIILFILTGLGFIALLMALSVLLLASYFALFAVSIEGSPVFTAVGSGFRRVFSGGELKRAVLMALAYGALQFGASLIAGVVGLILLLVFKAAVLQIMVSTIINAILSGFGTTLVAIYYYDVRVRRESYDLETDLQRLGAPVSA
jgi:hypothetical protein